MMEQYFYVTMPCSTKTTSYDCMCWKMNQSHQNKDKMWTLADDLVRVLQPAERTTALLSGQSYVTSACVLPIISSLVKHFSSCSINTL